MHAQRTADLRAANVQGPREYHPGKTRSERSNRGGDYCHQERADPFTLANLSADEVVDKPTAFSKGDSPLVSDWLRESEQVENSLPRQTSRWKLNITERRARL